MASLKSLRYKIQSVSNTKKITNIMEKVSSVKVNKFIKLIKYNNKSIDDLSHILYVLYCKIINSNKKIINNNIFFSLEDNSLASIKYTDNTLFVPIFSNRGLCSSYNDKVYKYFYNNIQDILIRNKSLNIDVLVCGKKGFNYNFNVNSSINVIDKIIIPKIISISSISNLYSILIEYLRSGKYNKIYLVYNKFYSLSKLDVVVQPILPLFKNYLDSIITSNNNLNSNYKDWVFDNDIQGCFNYVLDELLQHFLWKYILSANISENIIRRIAMHKSSDAANDIFKDLKLKYNKIRQSKITNEIIEVVSASSSF